MWCGRAAGRSAPPSDDVLALARSYLELEDVARRATIAARLDVSGCDPLAVVKALRPAPEPGIAPGYRRAEPFRSPTLRERYPDDLLYYTIPATYDPQRPTGMAIILHGGSRGTDRSMPHWYMRNDGRGSGLAEALDAIGFVGVAPSAPVSESSWVRWCLPGGEDYVRDVIVEFQERLSIDPDRVFLIGHSMGGFGAYHHVQVQPDRFAAVLVSAGSWYHAFWPVIRGTPLWIVHGARDSEPGGRPHFTDVAFARLADRLLTEQGIAHAYREHPDQHSLPFGMTDVRHFIERMPDVRRDPLFPRVAVVRPRGWRAGEFRDAPHNRWLSLLEVRPGDIAFDAARHGGPGQFWGMPRENWEAWHLVHDRQKRSGAMVEACYRGDNHFDLTTRNAARIAIWLHPAMVDFAQPVRVTVDGALLFNERVEPSVSVALDACERRRDWGLIYSGRVEFVVPADAPPGAPP